MLRRELTDIDHRQDHGPFDIVGDVHGCFDELVELLQKLGYEVTPLAENPAAHHTGGRKAVFLGDLVDRGPATPAVLRLVMEMVLSGSALCVPGNHDIRLTRHLRGRMTANVTHGFAQTLEQLAHEDEAFKNRVATFLHEIPTHYILDAGELVVAHAGLREDLHGGTSSRVRTCAIWGETTGERDEHGLPVRVDWADSYRGKPVVIYGHTPVMEPRWRNRTLCIDTGCVYGGKLTALRYPELELVQVQARRAYYVPSSRDWDPADIAG